MVTANKALLAEDGASLFAAAEAAGRDLYYEAAVAGAIPILRPLRESLAGDQVTRVLGIVNGTTNFILDRMDTAGTGFTEALEEAQALGYAEADPTADVEGFDAAAKAAILASLAFHTRVTAEDVHREGIAEVTASDVASAREMGSVVKLLAICALEDGPGGSGGLGPRAPGDDPAEPPAGERARGLQRGLRRERGRRPADVLRPRRRRRARRRARSSVTSSPSRATGSPASAVPRESAYADAAGAADGTHRDPLPRAIDVDDKAGVLAAVAQAFAEHDVSIQTVRQEGRGDDAQLVVVSHTRHRRGPRSDGRDDPADGVRARGVLGDAGRGGPGMRARALMAHRGAA